MAPDQLRCPTCGTPVPDTGIRSRTGTSAEPEPAWLTDSSAPGPPWKQHAKCPSCRRLLERNPDSPQLDQWRLPPQVASIGGTITLRATPTPMASAGVIRDAGTVTARASLSGEGRITAAGTVVASAPLPSIRVEAGINRAQWDMTCTGFGALVGQTMYGKGGAIIGGFTAYVWGRRQWPDDS